MTDEAASIDAMGEDAAMEELLAPIRERNRGKLLRRLANVRSAIVTGPAATTETIRADLHALVGALGTYGWTDGSDLLRRIHSTVAAGRRADEFVPELDALVREVSGE
jgi:hypothetical protein